MARVVPMTNEILSLKVTFLAVCCFLMAALSFALSSCISLTVALRTLMSKSSCSAKNFRHGRDAQAYPLHSKFQVAKDLY